MKLLFIHGCGCVKEGWYFQTKYFPEATAIDLPGHPKGKLCISVEEYSNWLLGQIIEKGKHDTILVGHSLGGAVALLYAIRHPEDLKGLVLIATGSKFKIDRGYIQEIWEAMNNKTIWKHMVEDAYRDLHPKVRDAVMKRQLEMGPLVRLSDYDVCQNFDITENLSQIDLPTLIICGNKDMFVPPLYSDYLVEKINGARKVIIEGAGHYVFMEKPDEVNRAITDFVASLK